jgi:predicted ATPase
MIYNGLIKLHFDSYKQLQPISTFVIPSSLDHIGTIIIISSYVSHIHHDAMVMAMKCSDDEVTQTHPVRAMLEGVGRAGSLTTLHLKPLNHPTVVILLMDTLGCADDVRTNRLAHLIMNKTNGSPFFVVELIRYLAKHT